jgi:hypothetical protein
MAPRSPTVIGYVFGLVLWKGKIWTWGKHNAAHHHMDPPPLLNHHRFQQVHLACNSANSSNLKRVSSFEITGAYRQITLLLVLVWSGYQLQFDQQNQGTFTHLLGSLIHPVTLQPPAWHRMQTATSHLHVYTDTHTHTHKNCNKERRPSLPFEDHIYSSTRSS